jgi:hypothetical protein
MTHVIDAKSATFVSVEMTDGKFGVMAEDADRPGVVGYGADADEALESLERARSAYDRLRQGYTPSGSLGASAIAGDGWRVSGGTDTKAGTF